MAKVGVHMQFTGVNARKGTKFGYERRAMFLEWILEFHATAFSLFSDFHQPPPAAFIQGFQELQPQAIAIDSALCHFLPWPAMYKRRLFCLCTGQRDGAPHIGPAHTQQQSFDLTAVLALIAAVCPLVCPPISGCAGWMFTLLFKSWEVWIMMYLQYKCLEVSK